jgi:2-iminobutanoate/2-iminopropanoate deaminase
VSDRIFTPRAPVPIGPYNQAQRAGGFIFCSGQIPLDPETGKLVDGDVGAQTRRVLENLSEVLVAAGTSIEGVVKTTIFLTDMADFGAVNTVYAEFFGTGEGAPARSTVAVAALPLGARVEIEAIAEER